MSGQKIVGRAFGMLQQTELLMNIQPKRRKWSPGDYGWSLALCLRIPAITLRTVLHPKQDALEKRGQLLASSQRPCAFIRDLERNEPPSGS